MSAKDKKEIEEYSIGEGEGPTVPCDFYSDGVYPYCIAQDADVNEYKMKQYDFDHPKFNSPPDYSGRMWKAYFAPHIDLKRSDVVQEISRQHIQLFGLSDVGLYGFGYGISHTFPTLMPEYRFLPGSKPQGLVCCCMADRTWFRGFLLRFAVGGDGLSRSSSLVYLFDIDCFVWVDSAKLCHLPLEFSESWSFPSVLTLKCKRRPPKPNFHFPDLSAVSDDIRSPPIEIKIPVERDLMKTALEVQVHDCSPCKPFAFRFCQIRSPTDFEIEPIFMPYVRFCADDEEKPITEKKFDQLLQYGQLRHCSHSAMEDENSCTKFGIPPLDWIKMWQEGHDNPESECYKCDFICAGKPRLPDARWCRIRIIDCVHQENHPYLFKVQAVDKRLILDRESVDVMFVHLLDMRLLPYYFIKRPIFKFKASFPYMQPVGAPPNSWKDPVWTDEPVPGDHFYTHLWDCLPLKNDQIERPPALTATQRLIQIAEDLMRPGDDKHLYVAAMFGIKKHGTEDEKILIDIGDLRYAELSQAGPRHEQTLWISEVLMRERFVEYSDEVILDRETRTLKLEFRNKHIDHFRRIIMHYYELRKLEMRKCRKK